MSSNSSTLNAYINVKKNRIKKKQKLYKLALGVSLDVTISIYLAAFIVFGGLILYSEIQQYQAQIFKVEEILKSNYQSVIYLIILRSMIGSFVRPGIVFSSAELMLSLLPHSRNQLWKYCLLEKLIKLLAAVLLATIILLMLVTDLSGLFLLSVLGLVYTVQTLMMIPQWRLYQRGTVAKISIIFVVIVLAGLVRLSVEFFSIDQWIAIVFFYVLLVGINIALSKKLFRHVNWMKVVETNDQLIWSMWFINKISNVEIKAPKKYGLLQQLFRSNKTKQAFSYQNPNQMYRRLWKLYFFEHKVQVFQTIGGIVLIMVLLSFHNEWTVGVGVSIAVFLFGQMAASFFVGGFDDKLVFSLPWDLQAWKQSFLTWVYGGGVFVLLIIATVLVFYSQHILWIPLQLVFYICVTIYFTSELINERCYILSRSSDRISARNTSLIILLFIIVALSISFPYLSVVFLYVYFMKITKRRSKPINHSLYQ
ncbi:hypothetical protein [Aquibacillus saliphilus]|uniref:hypothetical protein n=1 Tax=Aquibacillus saliphilus TaxID=1909422 RepID=UPI001CF01519|nr:hypothetical protein [Aquibacillus saliphilus]